MLIVADENIPLVQEAFGTLGEVITLPGRSITSDAIKQTKAEALIVRSVTGVGPELLRGSSVRFVGTATIGTDHLDLSFLKKEKIEFASAPGCNANSVAEYVIAALLFLARVKGFSLEGKSLGVIGVGNVGSRVVTKAQALGMKVLLNDPPLARSTGDSHYLPLEALMGADFLTLHVPLTMEGPDATYHMVNEDFLTRMRPDSILINTSRGLVVDEKALKVALRNGRIAAAVLDVWEHEPSTDVELLGLVALGTPHIAGYSFDGKVNGTFMVYQALCRYSGLQPQWSPDEVLSNQKQPSLVIDNLPQDTEEVEQTKQVEDVVDGLVRQLYDIQKDDANLRKITELAAEERGAYFDRLRKEYPVRREFHSLKVKLSQHDKKLSCILEALGFRIN